MLSENANFAEVCETCNIKFIGPPPEVTRLMGEKEKARAAMKKAGVPILPGSDGIIADEGEAHGVGAASRLSGHHEGFGRWRRARHAHRPQRRRAARTVQGGASEAAAAFGNGDLYMEKFIERPRHIEFQILADQYGNVVSLGERECSIQRRHQKLLEESPSTQVHAGAARTDRRACSCKTLTEIGYVNAGTIEFLMDEDRKLYFIEMNTRIQVEHPVTEMVTDVDLVKSQILLAAGERMEDVLARPIVHRGHAIECRINAEHPEKFTPSAGRSPLSILPGAPGCGSIPPPMRRA